MKEEIEIKVAIGDAAAVRALRARLRRLGATAQPRVFERNVLFDRGGEAGGELRREGKLLRVRLERPAPKRVNEDLQATARRVSGEDILRAILTYKEPGAGGGAEASNGGDAVSSLAGRYKRRKEIEVECTPGENLQVIFEGVGFGAGFSYEKFRTTYRLRRVAGLIVELDETPVGNFLELEGRPEEIDRGAALLGYAPSDYLTATYWDLHVAERRGRGVTPSHLLFDMKKKSPQT